MILPIAKKHIYGKETCRVPSKITVSCKGEYSSRGCEAFCSLFEGAVEVKENGFIEFEYDSSLENKPEIYRISVGKDKIKVYFRDERGSVNGASSVVLLLRKQELKQCEIEDYPSTSYRSFLMDMARGLPTVEDIKNTIRYMALAKYNRLHLHLIDSMGPCYMSEALPEYKYTGKSEVCSLDFLREIDKLCESYAIEVVPELEIPAHSTAVCKAHPEYKCPVDNNAGWAICPASDEVWEFYDKLVAELADVFTRSEYIHIGTDELEFGDLDIKYHCYWDECPQCAELRARYGLSDRQAEFYYVANKIFEIVKSHGKKMMMWNDQIDISKDVPLSREILIQFWRIAYPGRGPYVDCTFEKFLEKGFKVVNAFYPQTYLDMNHYLSSEKMKTWTPFNIPEQSPIYAEQVLGGETCAWEFGNYEEYPFYGYTTPPVLAIFGDKLWGLGEREYTDEYKAALAEYIFGSDELTDVFECIGDVIPPRKKDLEPAAASRDKLEGCLERLEKNKNTSYAAVSKKYIELIKKMM